MKLASLMLLAFLPAAATQYYDCAGIGSGNTTSATTFSTVAAGTSACNVGPPGDGDALSIRNGTRVILAGNLGTTGGGGIGLIDVQGNNSSAFVTDGLAQHTITTSATMAIRVFGQGTLDFSAGTGANYTKIQGAATTTTFGALYAGSASAPGNTLVVNFQHVLIGQGVCEFGSDGCISVLAGGTCTACVTLTVSDVVFQATGYGSGKGLTYVGNNGSSAYVSGSPSFSGLGIVGRPAIPMLYTAANPCSTWHFDYNWDYEPATTTQFIGGSTTPCGLTATGNVGYDFNATANSSPFILSQVGTATSAGFQFSYNIWDFEPTQSSIANTSMFAVNCGTTACQIDHNMGYNWYSAGEVLSCVAGQAATTWLDNWFASNQNTGNAQGALDADCAAHIITGNMVTWDSVATSSNPNIGFFCYSPTTPTCTFNASRNTAYYPTQGGTGTQSAFALGDGGIFPASSAQVLNSLAVNAGVGIQDEGANTWTTVVGGLYGAGYNDVWNAATAYLTQNPITSSNFCAVLSTACSPAHPNAIYHDVTINPALIAPGRRYKDADAFLGGPGNELHLFQQLIGTQTPLAAILGVAGGLSANQLYTPQAIYQFLAGGFTPTNNHLSLTTGASDGGYIGAVKPLCMGCWIP
jgi:hypothetical protein